MSPLGDTSREERPPIQSSRCFPHLADGQILFRKYRPEPSAETLSGVPFQKGVDVEAFVANISLPTGLVGSKVGSGPPFG